MQVTCSHCNKLLQIPDEKLPTDRQVRIGCPSCRQHFTFDPHDSGVASTPHAAQPAPQRAAVREGSDFNDLNIDVSEMGQAPRALICLDTPSHRGECEGILPSLGFVTVHAMSNQVQALAYLRYPFLAMPLLRQCPAPRNSPPRFPELKALCLIFSG